MRDIRLQAVRIAAEEGGAGLLVFADDWLLAVLSQLGSAHGPRAGHWFLEIGFGRFAVGEQPVFADEQTARLWFTSSLADRHVDDPWMI